jgi:hypothetical protein
MAVSSRVRAVAAPSSTVTGSRLANGGHAAVAPVSVPATAEVLDGNCCKCGTRIKSNPSAMCMPCLKQEVDRLEREREAKHNNAMAIRAATAAATPTSVTPPQQQQQPQHQASTQSISSLSSPASIPTRSVTFADDAHQRPQTVTLHGTSSSSLATAVAIGDALSAAAITERARQRQQILQQQSSPRAMVNGSIATSPPSVAAPTTHTTTNVQWLEDEARRIGSTLVSPILLFSLLHSCFQNQLTLGCIFGV